MNILSPSSGVVNQILNALGQDSIYFMADPKWFRAVLIMFLISGDRWDMAQSSMWQPFPPWTTAL